MNSPKFEIVGHGDGQPTLLHETATLSEARAWVQGYTAREDAGGWDCITCNATPFCDDYEFTWERGEGFLS